MSQQRKMKVCELSGQHEENGLPEKDCDVFSFFLSFGLFTQETTAEALLDYSTAQDSVTLFLKVFVLYSPLDSQTCFNTVSLTAVDANTFLCN